MFLLFIALSLEDSLARIISEEMDMIDVEAKRYDVILLNADSRLAAEHEIAFFAIDRGIGQDLVSEFFRQKDFGFDEGVVFRRGLIR